MTTPNPIKKICFTMALMASCFVTVCAQDLHFSQFFNAPLLRNPALAGIFTGDYRIQGVYRDQWNSLTNAYRTGSFNGEYKLPVGKTCLLYTSDAADEEDSVDLGGRRI